VPICELKLPASGAAAQRLLQATKVVDVGILCSSWPVAWYPVSLLGVGCACPVCGWPCTTTPTPLDLLPAVSLPLLRASVPSAFSDAQLRSASLQGASNPWSMLGHCSKVGCGKVRVMQRRYQTRTAWVRETLHRCACQLRVRACNPKQDQSERQQLNPARASKQVDSNYQGSNVHARTCELVHTRTEKGYALAPQQASLTSGIDLVLLYAPSPRLAAGVRSPDGLARCSPGRT